MLQIMLDRRGKVMVKSGRLAVAKHVRFLRAIKLGNAPARAFIRSAAIAYVQESERNGWTVGQFRHNRLVALL